MWVKKLRRALLVFVCVFITNWHKVKTFSFIYRTLLARFQHEVNWRSLLETIGSQSCFGTQTGNIKIEIEKGAGMKVKNVACQIYYTIC